MNKTKANILERLRSVSPDSLGRGDLFAPGFTAASINSALRDLARAGLIRPVDECGGGYALCPHPPWLTNDQRRAAAFLSEACEPIHHASFLPVGWTPSRAHDALSDLVDQGRALRTKRGWYQWCCGGSLHSEKHEEPTYGVGVLGIPVEVDHAAIERSMADVDQAENEDPYRVTVSGEWIVLALGDCALMLGPTGAEELAEVLTRAAKASRAWIA